MSGMKYIVNVEGAIVRGDQYLMIFRQSVMKNARVFADLRNAVIRLFRL